MVAPAVAAVAPVVLSAAKGAQHTLSEALTADLAVIRWEGRVPRKRKGIARKPVEYELHLNPAGIGIGVVGVAAAMWLFSDRNRRDGVARTVGSAWWDVAKYGSPLGYTLDKLGLV